MRGGLLADKVGFGKTSSFLGLMQSQRQEVRKEPKGTAKDAEVANPNNEETKDHTNKSTKEVELSNNKKGAKLPNNKKASPKKQPAKSKQAAKSKAKAKAQPQQQKVQTEPKNKEHDSRYKEGPVTLPDNIKRHYIDATNTTLILVPSNLMTQWSSEIKKFITEGRKVLVIDKVTPLKQRTVKELLDYDVGGIWDGL